MTRLWLTITIRGQLTSLAFIFLIGATLPESVRAQNPVADANDVIAFDQSGPSTTEILSYGFRYYLDGDSTGVNAVVVCQGEGTVLTCLMDMPLLSNGTHTIQITAINGAGESPKSDPFVFDFVIIVAPAVPPTPTGIRIIRR